MSYQQCVSGAQAAGQMRPAAAMTAHELALANINPATGLATDYLNHFNEAIMLLEMLSSCPECYADFLDWHAISYREHFASSRFKGRNLAIAAYEAADPELRERFDRLTADMTRLLTATRAGMRGMAPELTAPLAEKSAERLKILVARAGALINGEPETELTPSPQAVIDGLMQQ